MRAIAFWVGDFGQAECMGQCSLSCLWGSAGEDFGLGLLGCSLHTCWYGKIVNINICVFVWSWFIVQSYTALPDLLVLVHLDYCIGVVLKPNMAQIQYTNTNRCPRRRMMKSPKYLLQVLPRDLTSLRMPQVLPRRNMIRFQWSYVLLLSGYIYIVRIFNFTHVILRELSSSENILYNNYLFLPSLWGRADHTPTKNIPGWRCASCDSVPEDTASST